MRSIKNEFCMGALTMYKEYSVLMSVYQKECPEYLRAAITSIVNQTLKAKRVCFSL